MARKVQKTVNLSLDVVEALEEQENQSETTEEALREHLDV